MIQRLRNIVQRNFMAKVISLLAATALWAIVMDEQNPSMDKEYTVAVQLENPPQGYRITKNVESIKLQVRAQRALFANVESGDFKARLDLQGKGEGEYEIPVQVHMPQGFELTEAKPETISVKLDPFVEQPMKAGIVIGGRPDPSVTVANVTQNHEIVTVVGPKSIVKKVDRVGGIVELDGSETENLTRSVSLDAVDQEGDVVSGVRVVPSTLDVQIEMARSLSKKTVAVKAVLDRELPSGYAVEEVRVSPSKIEIAGDDQVIGDIQSVATEPISLSDHEKTFTVQAKLVLPEGITVTNPAVSVSIEVSKKT